MGASQKLDPATIEEIRTLERQGKSRSEISRILGVDRGSIRKYLGLLNRDTPEKVTAQIAERAAKPPDWDAAIRAMRKGPCTVQEIADRAGAHVSAAERWLEELADSPVNLCPVDGGRAFTITSMPQIATGGREIQVYHSRKDNTFVFAAMGDTHLGSKYERLEELHRFYQTAAEEGVDRVFHAGNWIEGEAKFNTYDIHVYGMTAQMRYLVENYPKVGLDTYAIHGDDHEGWYGQRFGVDMGSTLQGEFRAAGRKDWIDLGFMEADVLMVNRNTGKSATLRIAHPGGGSAYALSYSIQKIIECVPVDSEILTPAGWKRHDDLNVGDVVLGYNVETDKCEWTTVLNVHHGVSEVVRYHNDQFEVKCTPNHKWAIEWEQRGGPNPASRTPCQYSRRERKLWTLDESKDRSRIIQAAMAPSGPGLAEFSHGDWLHRTDIAVRRVLEMTSGERRAFVEGLLLGEGTIMDTKGYRTLIFSQRPGPVNDAFRLACFLEGIATTDRKTIERRGFEPCRRVVMLSKRMRNVGSLKREPLGKQVVWCPTTELGTWVMRQGNTITITGNSYEGGEKPAIGLYGHYHKLTYENIRNVFCVQTGTFQDQTPFMRKKRLEAHVGGTIIRATQDPDTGAIVRCQVELIRYFNRAYYVNGRWDKAGKVDLPARSL